MNYYEELGIKPNANGDDVRKAHRRLVKLMHPDQQRDPDLKVLAETQMRRLNSIVATLLDPERRDEYDDELRGRHLAAMDVAVGGAWRGVPWWLLSTAGAVILTVGAIWIWADQIGHSLSPRPLTIPSQSSAAPPSRNVSLPGSSVMNAGSDDPLNSTPSGLPSGKIDLERTPGGTALPAQQNPGQQSSKILVPVPVPQLAPSPAPPTRTIGDRKKPFQPPSGATPLPKRSAAVFLPSPPNVNSAVSSRTETAVNSLPALPSALAPRPDIVKPTAAVPLRSGAKLEGEWVYAPKEPEVHKVGFYPPQSISFRLSENSGSLRGQYHARYQISADDNRVSPEVSFQVASVDKDVSDKDPHRFVWQSNNGSRGTLVVRPIDDGSIRLEWRTTVFSPGPALTSGIATLVRRPVQ